jgi:hypothetical protein
MTPWLSARHKVPEITIYNCRNRATQPWITDALQPHWLQFRHLPHLPKSQDRRKASNQASNQLAWWIQPPAITIHFIKFLATPPLSSFRHAPKIVMNGIRNMGLKTGKENKFLQKPGYHNQSIQWGIQWGLGVRSRPRHWRLPSASELVHLLLLLCRKGRGAGVSSDMCARTC